MSDIELHLKEQIDAAIADKTPLRITGGDSKAFYGRHTKGTPLSVSAHQGIISYEPTELVITARAGTKLKEIENALAEHNQMLPFEPPSYGGNATLGGTIACNFSGPRRAYSGAARDFLLGTKVINGKGEILSFGGEVMKNVAGYDVSRLMCGAMGTLGVLLEVSLKVLPKPVNSRTLVLDSGLADAIRQMNLLAGKPLPVSATAWNDGKLYVRLSGTSSAVDAASASIGGQTLPDPDSFWLQIKEHQHDFFLQDKALWRLSLPPTHAPIELQGETLVEWGGGLRWLMSEAPPETIFHAAKLAGGHASLFRGNDRGETFQPLDAGLLQLHRNLKAAFDPHGIFNPGRMYQDI